MFKALTLVACLLATNVAFSEGNATYKQDGKVFEVEKTKKLKYGVLKIVVEEESRVRDVLYNSKSIFPKVDLKEDDYEAVYYYGIEKIFYIKNNEVVLMRWSLGGSGTIDSYFFLTLAPDSSTSMSEYFAPDNFDAIKVVQAGDKIVIDLGFNRKKQREQAIYQNGEVTVAKVSKNKAKKNADEDSCNYLYNQIYIEFVRKQRCNEEPAEVGGMATVRSYNSITNDPNINANVFERLSKKSCKVVNWVKYSEFKKSVCSGA